MNEMNCPRHNVELYKKTIAARSFYICPSCTGLWLTRGAIEKQLGAILKNEITKGRNGKPGSLKCPLDRDTLLQLSVRNVNLDCCSKCSGVWLDRGEIAKLLETQMKIRLPTTNGKAKQDPIWVSALDGASIQLPEIIAAIIEGLFDGI